MASFVPKIKLNNGMSMPAIGYGVGTANYGRECTQNVVTALKTGYRYIDCAQTYATSPYVGAALKQWGGKREDVFILTKCGVSNVPDEVNEPRRVLKEQLDQLGLEYVDMYLMHGPIFVAPLSLSENWKVMEQLVAEGLTKSIGVSNYREEDLIEMEKEWTIPPAVNQIEFHPYVIHAPNMKRLFTFMKKHDIRIQCFGPQIPLTKNPGGPVDPVVDKVAKEQGLTTGQTLLRWAKQKSEGVIVTTSRNEGRMLEQLDAINDFKPLPEADVKAIAEAGQKQFFRQFMLTIWDKAKP